MSLFSQPGPPLPSFKTLLVKGDYHASAPVHLALSQLAASGNPDAEAIIITPDRQAMTQALHIYKDSWLTENSGYGEVIALSSRIRMYYPSSPAHLCLLLSMFHVLHATDAELGAWINQKTTLAAPPSILILHEPSTYFFSGEAAHADSSRWTVSSYIGIIVQALSSTTFLLSNNDSTRISSCFALFDSRLDQMRLPILKQPDYQDEHPPRLESLAPLVQKYFEWMVTTDSEQELVDGDKKRKGMDLYRTDRYPEVFESWRWWESLNPTDTDARPGRILLWGDVGQNLSSQHRC